MSMFWRKKPSWCAVKRLVKYILNWKKSFNNGFLKIITKVIRQIFIFNKLFLKQRAFLATTIFLINLYSSLSQSHNKQTQLDTNLQIIFQPQNRSQIQHVRRFCIKQKISFHGSHSRVTSRQVDRVRNGFQIFLQKKRAYQRHSPSSRRRSGL